MFVSKNHCMGLNRHQGHGLINYPQNLIDIGFRCSAADSSLFIYKDASYTILLLIYVDDGVITGSSPYFIEQFIN